MKTNKPPFLFAYLLVGSLIQPMTEAATTANLLQSELAAPAYTLHEWGTFTSVSGSDGKLLNGLDREEEHLPSFVYALDGMHNHRLIRPGSKGISYIRPLRNVTIKMETPVIYFYSETPFRAQVKVDFQGGSISQWYPQRSSGETAPIVQRGTPASPIAVLSASAAPVRATAQSVPAAPQGQRSLPAQNFQGFGGIDFQSPRRGSITWNVDVLDKDANRGLAFKPGETLNWIRPRTSAANLLKVGNEYEDYLFYRGVGNFALPINLSVDQDEVLKITNNSKEQVPFLFVHEITADHKTRFLAIPQGITSGGSIEIPVAELKSTVHWQASIYQQMLSGLTDTGLYPAEANGMIQTWWKSYFTTPGLRVFWVVPRSDTEAILPLSVNPAPKQLVRTLVGRSEVLRPSFEKTLVEAYQNTQKTPLAWKKYADDRFGKAYLQRVQTLTQEKEKVAKQSKD